MPIALAASSGERRRPPCVRVNARLLDAGLISASLPVRHAVSGLFGSEDIHGEFIQGHGDWLLRVHTEHERAFPASRQAIMPVDVGDGWRSLTAFPRGKNYFAQRHGRLWNHGILVKGAEHKGGIRR